MTSNVTINDLDSESALDSENSRLELANAANDSESADSEYQPTTKNWNFPKMHTNSHVFNDIVSKGVTRNYNTKPNEGMHRPLKNIYRDRTNFKNVAEQVSLPTS